jgi:molybdenum cofactor cytidylyltransferase
MGVVNKLMARIEGVPLVTSVVRAALASRVGSVTVVTGYEMQAIQRALTEYPVSFVHNPDYSTGLASSVRVGLSSLPQETDAILILLGDMPFIEPHQINRLIDEFEQAPAGAIVVPVYAGRPGNPRLWSNFYFEAMAGCDGDSGPKDLLKQFSARVRRVAMSDAQVLTDIDTPAELAQFAGSRHDRDIPDKEASEDSQYDDSHERRTKDGNALTRKQQGD